ncbi:MAG: electron transfer flavoprotein subunit beta/FixA family protein [Candidatus Omnitrophota bacterium]
MNIIVCIKQVPETTEVRIDPKTNTLIREGVKSIINPFDMYAIEEGLRIKEKTGGKVTVITMGPPQAREALKQAIAMGADDAVLLSDRAFAGSDTWATSYTLSRGISKIGEFDLIICGKQATDGDTAQVGPGIAEHLNIPCAAFVKKIEKTESGRLIVESMREEGFDVLELPTPCIITVVKEINEPRLPSLKGMMLAKKKEIKVWGKTELELNESYLGLNGSPTQVVKIFTPPQKEGGIILEGSPEEVTEKLFSFIEGEIS